jgi:hypothetical protein
MWSSRDAADDLGEFITGQKISDQVDSSSEKSVRLCERQRGKAADVAAGGVRILASLSA